MVHSLASAAALSTAPIASHRPLDTSEIFAPTSMSQEPRWSRDCGKTLGTGSRSVS